MNLTANKKIPLIALGFFIIILIIYFPEINALRYGDDFNVVPEGVLKSDLINIWTTPFQREMFYRPLEDTITTIIIHFFGWNTLPVHLFIYLFHAALVSFTYLVMINLKFSRISALLGSLYILIAQVNVFSVGSNDTIGTMLSSFFCLTSLWLFYSCENYSRGKLNKKLYIASLILFTISLLSKEASVTFFPLLLVLLIYENFFLRKADIKKISRSFILILPFLMIFTAYFIIHSRIVPIQPSAGSENYNFRLGTNLPKNIGLMLFSIFLPVSSVRTFEAVELRNYKFLLIAIFLTALLAGIIIYGLWRSKKIKKALVWMCFLIAGFFPVALMNHINEQYTYFSMPFVAILAGTGLSYFLENLKGKSRIFLTSLIIIYFLLNSLSVLEKSKQIHETGERADMLFNQIKNYLPQVEHNGSLVLVNPPGWQLKYSVFRLPGFETMRYAQFYIYNLAGRQDFKIEICEWNEAEKWKQPHTLMLKLEGDKIVRFE